MSADICDGKEGAGIDCFLVFTYTKMNAMQTSDRKATSRVE